MVDIHRVDAAEEGYAPEAREPAGYRLSDASIKEQIFRQLALGEGLDAGGITVEVRDGEVTLSGSARCYADMQRIEELACAIEGVKLAAQRPHVSRTGSAGRRWRSSPQAPRPRWASLDTSSSQRPPRAC